jgi:hypothetical protein
LLNFKNMSLLELKQHVSRLSQRERMELQAYMIRLRHGTPSWKRATAKKIRNMQAGKFTSIETLEARFARG